MIGLIKFQALFKGFIYRRKNLPISLLCLKEFLQKKQILISKNFQDGRLNSNFDEIKILEILKEKYKQKIIIPNKRMWYDFLFFDLKFGLLPINIKSSFMNTSDNVGNLAICIQSYINYDLDYNNLYNSGEISKILIENIKNKNFNKKTFKDYYFLIIDKNNGNIILNSLKGISKLTPNNNNLPFQIKWNDNLDFKYIHINKIIEIFISLYDKTTWKENFLNEMINIKKIYGQYFTENILLQEKVNEFIKNNPNEILEPSVGKGHLVKKILETNKNIKFDMYEIDNNISLLEGIDQKVYYTDFLTFNFNKKYNTIIGNPPYFRTKTGNLYLDFIEKCYNLLNFNGELIFIVPTDIFKLTSSIKLLNNLMKNGTFTDIYYPNNENLFKNASIDILIFRYCKNKNLDKKCNYNNKIKFINNCNGMLLFNDTNLEQNKNLNFYFDIYVGIVSGADNIFNNNELGNINLLVGKNKFKKFILVNDLENIEIKNYLEQYKEKLLSRKIKKFTEKNWFEWGALRNIKTIKNNLNKDCLFIHNLTRNEEICFISKVKYFSGNLIILIPKNENIDLNFFCNFLNSKKFKDNFIQSGRFKIGQRQLENFPI